MECSQRLQTQASCVLSLGRIFEKVENLEQGFDERTVDTGGWWWHDMSVLSHKQ